MVTNSPVSSSTNSPVSNPTQIRLQTEIEIQENTSRKKENVHSPKIDNLSSSQPKVKPNQSTKLYFQNEIEVDNSSPTARNNVHNKNTNNSSSNNNNIVVEVSYQHEDETNNNHNQRCQHSKNNVTPKNSNKLYFKLNLSSLNTRNNYVKTGLALLYAMIAMNFNLFILAIVHERVPINTKPLPDLGFDLFPRIDWVLNISEYIIMGEFTSVIIMIILHKYRQLLIRRLSLIIGTLYIFRGICMISTVFPVANDKYYCAPQLNKTEPVSKAEFAGVIFQRVFFMFWGMGLSINGKHNYCGDYMYSGHTVMLTLCYLMVREYLLPYRLRTLHLKLINLLMFSFSCAGVICVIISRGHYLIDILVAYYVTTRIFWIYHTMAHNQLMMIQSPFNHLSRVWWFPLFQFFEVNCENINNSKLENQTPCSCAQPRYCDCIIATIPRVFEWPLPWPRNGLFRKRNGLLPCHQRLLPQTA